MNDPLRLINDIGALRFAQINSLHRAYCTMIVPPAIGQEMVASRLGHSSRNYSTVNSSESLPKSTDLRDLDDILSGSASAVALSIS